ncbi:MAG: hypothetical protein K9G36_04865 [Crocinitomicaceae bacterium]|nr:hypothetical protein [Crocinitomicaceae bacterium]MCF8409878.1 hypothetical protein [Crocinitomicaceae bacterium]MCF8443552.1 hypothetical protein [Crocinitomicaceae bacterium]
MYKINLFLAVILLVTSCSDGNLEVEKLKLEQEKLKLEQEKLNIEKNKGSEATKGENKAPQNDQQASSGNNGKINGNNVLVRSDHSIQGNRKAVLTNGQLVKIVDEYRPEGNDNEAILRSATPFYNDYSGNLVFTLNKGKAVMIESYEGNQYKISYEDDKTGKTGYAKISSSQLEFISGDVWYHITTSSGVDGWVFGKFIQKL